MGTYLYEAQDGHFAPAPVKARKGEASKPVRFAPVAANGEDRVPVLRHALSDETLAAYLAESDAEKRAAILADNGEPNVQAANVSPTGEQLASFATILGTREAVVASLAAGVIIIQSESRAKSAATAGKSRAEREAERAEAALALMFPEPVAPVEGEPTDAPSDDAGEAPAKPAKR